MIPRPYFLLIFLVINTSVGYSCYDCDIMTSEENPGIISECLHKYVMITKGEYSHCYFKFSKIPKIYK